MKKPNLSFLSKRQTQYGAYVVVYTAVVLAVLVLVNWAVNRHGTSWDLTSNQRYSLSDQTRKIVRGLDQDVTVYYFDRQAQFTRARDLLDQYERLSPRLTVQYIDPDRQPGPAREMEVKAYGTVILAAAGRRQEANMIEEESVTNSLVRLVKGGAKGVCFVEGHGEHDLDDSDRQGLSRARKAL
jgi:ABC-type uncharacterized transport system involved in gliding motility auxiliary subunit